MVVQGCACVPSKETLKNAKGELTFNSYAYIEGEEEEGA